ncbi:MAG: M48 family metalloprotease [Deltaproteobacteria bacterium]|nr:M48 family metalloprotease [Deltaproteobacteria bacterium]
MRSGPKAIQRGRRGVLAVAALLLAACAVNPVTHRSEFSLMSEAQEVREGEEAYPLYTQMSEGVFQDQALQVYVQSVGERLARASHRPNLDYRYNVVNSSEINAYALPGGKISITRGLLARMRNEAELAAVLGHETGHVTARHQAAGYTRQVLTGLLTTVGVAALETANVRGADVLAQGGLLAANLVLTKYSRDQERQADDLGMDYMTRAGYNPEGMVETMRILLESQQREPSAVEAMFQSHPLSSERLATAEARIPAQDRALLTPEALKVAPFQAATAHLRAVAPAYAKMDEGRKLLGEKKEAEALQLLEAATVLAPDQALLWVYRAAGEVKAGKTEAALSSADRAVTLYPDLFQARFTAGVAAYEAKKYAESINELSAADKLVPGQPQVAFFLGRGYEAEGERENAARQYAGVVQKVQKGPMAEYSYSRLVAWGYAKPPVDQKQ